MNLNLKPEWLEWLKAQWNPKPIDPPAVNPDITNLHPLERSGETIVHTILSAEYWISPNGQVREWLRHNVRLSAWIAAPAFLILPIVTFVFAKLGAFLSLLAGILMNLVLIPILALVAWGVIITVKSLFGKK